MSGCIIYGGSFNPVHIGHLRLAMEVSWLLSSYADHLDFVPASFHPQKNAKTLLPLTIRMEMIRVSIRNLPFMTCNGIEGERNKISYTIDTIKYYLKKYSGDDLFFLMGSQDYALLRSWYKWQELTSLCNFAIVPRGDFTFADFSEITARLWPDQRHEKIPVPDLSKKCPAAACLSLAGQSRSLFLPIPWLNISSSYIRALWRQKRNPEWLMPPEALEILKSHAELVNSFWNAEDNIC